MVSRGGLAWLEAERLGKLPWLVQAFSTRRGGVSPPPCAGLNLGFTASDTRERVEENRRRFLTQLGAEDFVLAPLRQIHSSHSWVVDRDRAGRVVLHPPGVVAEAPAGDPRQSEIGNRKSKIPRAEPPATDSLQSEIGNHKSKTPKGEPLAGDGLITAEPGILLTIRTADCLPVLLVDPRQQAVAAVHAGWRGALAGVIEKAVGDMRRALGSDPGRLIAALGPSIRVCCYEVGAEVVDAFHGRFARAERFFQPLRAGAATERVSIPFLSPYPPGHAPEHSPAARLDLTAVARDQLARAGLKAAHVLVADYCTACRTDLFFSHRREGSGTGRQMAAVGIRRTGNRE